MPAGSLRRCAPSSTASSRCPRRTPAASSRSPAARAVAQANILLELAAPLAKDKIVLMKGNINDELKNSKHFETELGIKLLAKKEFFLPIENSKRTLICYEKIAKTPLKYPRRYDQIKKRPL